METNDLNNTEKVKTNNKKSLKTKGNDIWTLIFGWGFILTLCGLLGYWAYKDFIVTNDLLQYFYIGVISLIILIFLFAKSQIKYPVKIINDNLIVFYFILVFGIPLLFLIIKLFLSFFSMWSIWISFLLILIIIYTWFTGIKLVKKILLTALTIISIYFLVKSNDIFRIEYHIYFNEQELFQKFSEN